jgi:hypothetical protein
MDREHPRRLISVGDPEAPPCPVEMRIDRVFGDPQLTADLFGAQVIINQAQTFTLALGQQLKGRFRVDGRLPHGHHN